MLHPLYVLKQSARIFDNARIEFTRTHFILYCNDINKISTVKDLIFNLCRCALRCNLSAHFYVIHDDAVYECCMSKDILLLCLAHIYKCMSTNSKS